MTQTYASTFCANPVQRGFILSRAEADLFASRFGEGKSAALAWSVFNYHRHNPGVTAALVRDTWANFQATTLEEFFYWFPPGVFGVYNKTDKTFTWKIDGMGDAVVRFLGMDDPSDAAKLQSLPLGFVGFDEAAPAVQSGGIDEIIFDVALGRVRARGAKYYSVKVVTNNPDESHWTYRRFVNPGSENFKVWQTKEPENLANLPPEYYEKLRRQWAHRPDFIKRFIDGDYGFTQIGKSVTPEWNDRLHLATGLVATRAAPLTLLWDFGLTPACVITQTTPMRHWNILEAFTSDEMGVEELIETAVKPRLAEMSRELKGLQWRHVGDPAGTIREQTSITRSAVVAIRAALGGAWRSGPVKLAEGLDPLRAVLRQTNAGKGVVQVDRVKAKAVREALRGGWHYHVTRTGLTSTAPVKNFMSHPGDCMRYGAAVLFPLGKLQKKKGLIRAKTASFFDSGGLGMEKPGLQLPAEARILSD